MNAKELSQAIQTYVRTETFPVGVKLVKAEGDLPAKAKRPVRDLGHAITICQAVSFSRRYGWSIAMNGTDLSCPIAQVAFGYEQQLPFYTEGMLWRQAVRPDAGPRDGVQLSFPRCGRAGRRPGRDAERRRALSDPVVPAL